MQPDITVNKIPLTLSRFPRHAILFTTSPHKCIHCLIIQHRGGYFAYTAPPCMRTCRLINAPVTLLTELRQLMRVG